MISQAIWATKVDQNANKWLPYHQKMKCLFLDYVQLLMISQAIQVTKVDQNAKKNGHQIIKKWNAWFWNKINFWWSAKLSEWQKLTEMQKKWLPNHQKMKCSFLDYIQLLMIGRAIWVMKVNQNAKKDHHIIKKWNAHIWIMFNFWW